ncbi:response regulator [Thermostilla marina]
MDVTRETPKKRILFVDDERKLLDGLRRLLRSHRREWDMRFAESGAEALEMLQEAPTDVVVSDMRMPGMSGAELLETIRQRYPATVRLILSGQCDKTSVLKAAGPAHQFLSKPCDAELLKSTVCGVSNLRDKLKNDAIRSRVSAIVCLPCQPQVIADLRTECGNANTSIDALAEIASRDIGVTAKLVQLVSSSFFGSPQRVSGAAQAARLLGTDVMRPLVLETEALQPLEASPKATELLTLFNRVHEAIVAGAMKIGKAEGLSESRLRRLHLAGRLMNVGMLVLATQDIDFYISLLEKAVRYEMALPEVEREVFQATRNEVGAYFLALWGLPRDVITVAKHVRTPSEAPTDDPELLEEISILHVVGCVMDESLSDLIGRPQTLDREFLERRGWTERLEKWQDMCSEFQFTGVSA